MCLSYHTSFYCATFIFQTKSSIKDNTFSGCSNLTGVTIPSSVTSIGTSAFYLCSKLAGMDIPNSVTDIGGSAFRGCSSLTDVILPAGVTRIGFRAFDECSSLTSAFILGGVTSIESETFGRCSSLTSVYIPNSVTDIGGSAFSGCNSLTDVFYGGSVLDWADVWVGSYNGQLSSATIHFNAYFIIFDPNGGSVSTELDITGNDGTLSDLPTPTRKGYPFDGWYTDAEGGSAVTTATVFDSHSVVYAHWTAPYVVLSPQKLAVNGKNIDCEKYNIDGANYFKLRDLAYVLNGTGSQFGVGFDAATSTVTITTGTAYTSNGTELGEIVDNSSTAQISRQTILIDGVECGDLSVYNIGGANFFKLRDLGDALGFEVDYDADSNTAIVRSAQTANAT